MKTRIKTHMKKTPYFNNAHECYGRYQWNVKRYDWHIMNLEKDDDFELILNDLQRDAIMQISDVLNIPCNMLDAHFDGRSGGWLVIDSPLEPLELARIDRMIEKYHESDVNDLF